MYCWYIILVLYKNPLFSVDKKEAQVLVFIYWDCKILSGTATFHKRGVLDCNFQNPSEIPANNLCFEQK